MRISNRFLATALGATVFAAAIANGASAASPAALSTAEVTKSLQTIKTQADLIATNGKNTQRVRDAARTIGVEWQKVEPAVAKEYLVETKFANESIATFERDWQDASKAKAAAKDVSAKVAELLSVQRQTATPEPSPGPSGTPSPVPTGNAPAGSQK